MKTTTMIRTEEETLNELRRIAEIETRSLNGQINHFLEHAIQGYCIIEEKKREHNQDYEKLEGANK